MRYLSLLLALNLCLSGCANVLQTLGIKSHLADNSAELNCAVAAIDKPLTEIPAATRSKTKLTAITETRSPTGTGVNPDNWQCFSPPGAKDWICQNITQPEVLYSLDEMTEEKHRIAQMSTSEASKRASINTRQKNLRFASILQLPQNYYAVQLIALSSQQKAVYYAEKLGYSAQNIVQIHSQGNDWYILLAGVYGNYQEANKAVADSRLPHNPWIRPLGPLQKLVRAAKQNPIASS